VEDELKPCPFCGGTDLVVYKVSQQLIDVYSDAEQEALDQVMQATAIVQCNTCFARVGDWARLGVSKEVLGGFTGAGTNMRGEHIKFLDRLESLAKACARTAWNRRV
jgi:hypothetical protein